MRAATRFLGAVSRSALPTPSSVRAGTGLTIIGWHRIDRGPTGLSTSFDDFRRHLDVLEERGAAVLPLLSVVEGLGAGTLPEHAVVLTFDDGYASVLDLAWPELQRRGWPATLFAVPGYVDSDARFPWDAECGPHDRVSIAGSAALVAAAREGLEIGSHTVTHPWLPHLRREDIALEVRCSRDRLEQMLQRPVRTFAYPMGGWNAEVRQEVEAAGYAAAITVDRGANPPTQDVLSLRRAFAFDRVRDFRWQLDGAYDWMRPVERWRTRNGPR